MSHELQSYRSRRLLAPAAVALAAIIAACASNQASAGAPTLAPQATAALRQAEPGVYRADQVSKPVAQVWGNMPPHYPETLKSAGIGGVVVLAFIVDTAGRVDVGSATVLQLTDDRFLSSVVAALPLLRFTPAEFAGRKVRQLVAQPYYFGLTDTTKAHGPQTIDQAVKTLTGAPLSPIKP
jgi:TonB family protein